MEDLTPEHMGRGRANPGEPGQGQRLLGCGLLSVLIARGLELREPVHHQPQTAAFPFELCLEGGGKVWPSPVLSSSSRRRQSVRVG
jgi:hypothetical protein